MRILRNIFITLLILFVVAILSLQVFIFYITRDLPWQKPSFDTAKPADPGVVGDKGVLIFSKTNGFRHESIPAGIAAITKAGKALGWDVRATENGAFFNDDYLRRFKVVVFLSTTGDILTEAQQKAFERWIERGGGYAGIHSAADTEYDWSWYDHLLGTHFRNHPIFPDGLPMAELVTEDRTSPMTLHLPPRWTMKNEWYNFKKDVRGTQDSLHVLLSLNENSYKVWWPSTKFYYPGKMGGDHPVSWTNVAGKGRMFYTALGHTPESFTDSLCMPHIMAGIAWAGRF